MYLCLLKLSHSDLPRVMQDLCGRAGITPRFLKPYPNYLTAEKSQRPPVASLWKKALKSIQSIHRQWIHMEFSSASGQFGAAVAGDATKPSLHIQGRWPAFPLIPRVNFYHLLSQPSLGGHPCCFRSQRLQSTSRIPPPVNKHQTQAPQMDVTHSSSLHPSQVLSPPAS